MDLTEEIQSAVKSKKAVIGFRDSIKSIKDDNSKIVVVANNIPAEMKKEIESSIKSDKIKLEVFEGSSKDLGVICGKPFPISTLTIRD